MENIDKYKKGCTLMKSAIEKYEKGDINGGDKDREMANHFFDQKENTPITFSEKDDFALYGENKNFGTIYNVIEENVKTILKEKQNYKAIKEIIDVIKKNDVLKEQFNCYIALKDKVISNDIDQYIDEAIDLMPSINKKSLLKANTELINLIRKNNLNECIHLDDEEIRLNEAIEFFILNKKKLNNINEYNLNKTIIKEHFKKNQLVEEQTKINGKDYDNEVKTIFEKYNNGLNEDEIALLNELNENDNRVVFEKYKNETLNFISEQIQKSQDVNEKIDWNNILTKISIKQFNQERILEDIVSLLNVQNIITE